MIVDIQNQFDTDFSRRLWSIYCKSVEVNIFDNFAKPKSHPENEDQENPNKQSDFSNIDPKNKPKYNLIINKLERFISSQQNTSIQNTNTKNLSTKNNSTSSKTLYSKIQVLIAAQILSLFVLFYPEVDINIFLKQFGSSFDSLPKIPKIHINTQNYHHYLNLIDYLETIIELE